MEDIVFRIKNLSRKYSGDKIHFPDEIRVPRGEMIGVLGPSGSGKTTLLNLLALMDEADGGEITYYSATGAAKSYDTVYGNAEEAARFRKDEFGFVFQNDELLDGFSVRDNIQMPYWSSAKELDPPSFYELLAALNLDVIVGVGDRNPADLSAGQRSRIGLLRAFSGDPPPQVIFADEPTANVDAHLETEIYRLLERWRTDPNHPGRTLLLSTHRLDIASRYCTTYIIIRRDKTGASKGILLPGKRTEAELHQLVVGDFEKESEDLPGFTSVEAGTQPHGRLRALWKFLFYDFWRYPRARNNFLVSRAAPLLFILTLVLFVWLGSFILGIREGSSQQYNQQIQNDLLWNTEISAAEKDIQELMAPAEGGLKLVKSYHGFFRLPLSIFRPTDSGGIDDVHFGQLSGRSMENDDPLLDKIGETLIYPTSPQERTAALQRFRDADFGIIVSADALVESLGYTPKRWPTEVIVKYDDLHRVPLPVIAVAREIPGGDFAMNVTVYSGYTDREFLEKYDTPETFLLKPASEDLSDEAVQRLEKWLTGIGIENDQVRLRNFQGEQLLRVNLPAAKAEYEIWSPLKKNMDQAKDLITGIRFPKNWDDYSESRGTYSRWSVILNQKTESIRQLIQECYKRNMIIDTSVRARVEALQKSNAIFETMSLILFVTALVLSSVLLFTTTWFDSNRKVHSVGVMLGLGVSRPFLISAYAIQFYLLLGALLVTYVLADLAGGIKWFADFLGKATLGAEGGLLYSGWSNAWFAYIGIVLLVVPAVIGGLRFLVYRNQPAELLNFRD